jgi:hypothetical protein
MSHTYSYRGFTRSLKDENTHVLQAIERFRDMPKGGRILLSSMSFYIDGKLITGFYLLERESDNHWVRVDDSDIKGPVIYHAEFPISMVRFPHSPVQPRVEPLTRVATSWMIPTLENKSRL